jgi:hypothetical protein
MMLTGITFFFERNNWNHFFELLFLVPLSKVECPNRPVLLNVPLSSFLTK